MQTYLEDLRVNMELHFLYTKIQFNTSQNKKLVVRRKRTTANIPYKKVYIENDKTKTLKVV